MLEHSGLAVNYPELVDRVYIPGRRGSLQAEMMAAIRSSGRIAYRLPPELDAILAELVSGRPVLVLENLGLARRPVWHYAVLVGYDRDRNRLVLRSGETREQRISARRWQQRWDRAGNWAVVALAPGEMPRRIERERWLAAAADFDAANAAEATRVVWNRTLEYWPESPIAWLGVGNSAFAGNDFATAIAAYRNLLDLAPDHGPGRFNLAVALERSGQPCLALEHLAELVDHPQLGEMAGTRLVAAEAACRLRPD